MYNDKKYFKNATFLFEMTFLYNYIYFERSLNYSIDKLKPEKNEKTFCNYHDSHDFHSGFFTAQLWN